MTNRLRKNGEDVDVKMEMEMDEEERGEDNLRETLSLVREV